jgi:DNA-directed RNA polymerase subunit RPC12/RpoP
MTSTFSTSVRLLACEHCGAPLESSHAGDRVRCRYCQSQNVVDARDDSPLAVVARAPCTAEERLARLRQQDGRHRELPPGIASMLDNDAIAPWKIEEAIVVWQAARREARAGSIEAGEKLVCLTRLLADHFGLGTTHDAARHRSMCESALDALTLPRHRQVMRGMLSRAACDDGDLDAAEAWLAPCDSWSDDLETDTAYLVSRAYLDTALARFEDVKKLLSSRPPVMDAYEALAVLLLANAWERSGDRSEAIELLCEAWQSDERMARDLARAHASSKLCPQSYLLMHLPAPPGRDDAERRRLWLQVAWLTWLPALVVFSHWYFTTNAASIAATSDYTPGQILNSVMVWELIALIAWFLVVIASLGDVAKYEVWRRAALAWSMRRSTVLGVTPRTPARGQPPQLEVDLEVSLADGACCRATAWLPATGPHVTWLRPGGRVVVQRDAEEGDTFSVSPG